MSEKSGESRPPVMVRVFCIGGGSELFDDDETNSRCRWEAVAPMPERLLYAKLAQCPACGGFTEGIEIDGKPLQLGAG